jgi:PIN domain nuclease of toxin-antitoxin system
MVSAASVWEAAVKLALGKLRLGRDLATETVAHGFSPLAIAFSHAIEAGGLPPHHGDPFDRMLVAQARVEALTLVSRDPVFGRYDVPILAA